MNELKPIRKNKHYDLKIVKKGNSYMTDLLYNGRTLVKNIAGEIDFNKYVCYETGLMIFYDLTSRCSYDNVSEKDRYQEMDFFNNDGKKVFSIFKDDYQNEFRVKVYPYHLEVYIDNKPDSIIVNYGGRILGQNEISL